MVTPGWLVIPPAFTSTGTAGPVGASSGSRKSTCTTPDTNPCAAPAYVTSATCPSIRTEIGATGRARTAPTIDPGTTGRAGLVPVIAPSSLAGFILPTPVAYRLAIDPLSVGLRLELSLVSPLRIAP